MTNKKFHFIAGLPRSGSTLLCNILCQNPNFHATSSSGVLELVLGIRNTWDTILELKASPNEKAKSNVMRGIFDSFYADIDKPIIFDKSRGWNAFIGLLEDLFEDRIKILATVRDVRDVLTSFEKIWRRDSSTRQISQEKDNFVNFQTLQGRVDTWMSGNQPVGMAYNRLVDAMKRGFKDRIHLIDFDDLTRNPKSTMEKAYDFLGETYFEHDFNDVKQVTKEDDTVYGFSDLHTIRSKVEPLDSQWSKILGKDFEKYGKLNFWKD